MVIASGPRGPNGLGATEPAWVPDGKTIVAVVSDNQGDASSAALAAFDVATGKAQVFYRQSAARLSSPTWLPAAASKHAGSFSRLLYCRSLADALECGKELKNLD